MVTVTELFCLDALELPSDGETASLLALVARRWPALRPVEATAVRNAMAFIAFAQRNSALNLDRSLGFFADRCAAWHRATRVVEGRTNARAMLVAAIAARVPYAIGMSWPSASLALSDFGMTARPMLPWRRTLTGAVPEPVTGF